MNEGESHMPRSCAKNDQWQSQISTSSGSFAVHTKHKRHWALILMLRCRGRSFLTASSLLFGRTIKKFNWAAACNLCSWIVAALSMFTLWVRVRLEAIVGCRCISAERLVRRPGNTFVQEVGRACLVRRTRTQA